MNDSNNKQAMNLTIFPELNGCFEYAPEIADQPNLCHSAVRELKLSKAISTKLAGSPEISPEIADGKK